MKDNDKTIENTSIITDTLYKAIWAYVKLVERKELVDTEYKELKGLCEILSKYIENKINEAHEQGKADEREKLKQNFFTHLNINNKELIRLNIDILDKKVLPEQAKYFEAYHWIFDEEEKP